LTDNKPGISSDEFWDSCFRSVEFDFILPSEAAVVPIVTQLKRYSCKKVLDLGCGFGRWAITLARLGFAVTAVDISSAAINWVQRWMNRENVQLSTIIADAREFVADETFDAIICNSVLDHMTISDARSAIRNIYRLLGPSGVAYLTFDGAGEDEDSGPFEKLGDSSRIYVSGLRKGMIWRFYTDDEIRGLFAEFGLLEFSILPSGRRDIWVIRPTDESS
jgi:SAM-dependent methyltransferase